MAKKEKKYYTRDYEKDYGKNAQRLKIEYTGKKPDNELDERIAGLLEHPPFNFKWTGQGYDFITRTRDISFIRRIK